MRFEVCRVRSVLSVVVPCSMRVCVCVGAVANVAALLLLNAAVCAWLDSCGAMRCGAWSVEIRPQIDEYKPKHVSAWLLSCQFSGSIGCLIK